MNNFSKCHRTYLGAHEHLHGTALYLRTSVPDVVLEFRWPGRPEVFEMPRRRRTSVQKNSHETRVVQFSRSPSILAASGRGVKVSQKLEQKTHPVISSGADPGPAGFDWEELKSMDDKD